MIENLTMQDYEGDLQQRSFYIEAASGQYSFPYAYMVEALVDYQIARSKPFFDLTFCTLAFINK